MGFQGWGSGKDPVHSSLAIPSALLLIILGSQLETVTGHHATAQCVQLGQANMNYVRYTRFYQYYRWGYWTIGTRKFDTRYAFLDFFQTTSGDPKKEPDYSKFDVNEDCYKSVDYDCGKRRKRRDVNGSQQGQDDVDPADGINETYDPFFQSENELTGDNGVNGSRNLKKRQLKKPGPIFFEVNTNGSTPCPYRWKNIPSVNFCPEDSEVEIRTYAVKEEINGRSQVLNGWLYFEIELMDKQDQLLAVYIQVRDEFFNAIGEFVSEEKEQCNTGPNNSSFAQPTPYQILPCSAVGYREPENSEALFMARKQMLKDPSKVNESLHLPADDLMKRGIRFTWRLSEYWCNRHLRFRPEAIIFTKKMAYINNRGYRPNILRKAAKYWIRHKWYGAADVKRPATTLSCNDKVIDYKTGAMAVVVVNGTSNLVAPWLLDNKNNGSVLSIMENDYMHPDQYEYDPPPKDVHFLKSCHANTRDTNFKDSPTFVEDSIATFSGRCKHHYLKNPSHDALQGCNLNASAPEFKDLQDKYNNKLTNYTSYVQELFINRTKLCTVTCRPPTKDNISQILSYNDTSNEKEFNVITRFHSESRLARKLEQFYVGRKYHAVLCIYWTMFLIPVGIFVARYLKETWMHVTCTGVHLWFWAHCGAVLMSFWLSGSSLAAIFQTLDTWGRSEQSYGSAHRVLGYISGFLFLMMMLIGGVRSIHVRLRQVIMTLHAVTGFVIYSLNLVCMILSSYIPASPSMGNDCFDDGTPKEPGDVLYVILIWIGMDAVLHVAMTTLQWKVDKQHGIQRSWWCPVAPILPTDSEQDLTGSRLRKMALGAYVLAAFIMTNTAVGLLTAHDPTNQTCLGLYGPRTCDTVAHPYGCSSAAMGYEKYVMKEAGMNKSGSYIFVSK